MYCTQKPIKKLVGTKLVPLKINSQYVYINKKICFVFLLKHYLVITVSNINSINFQIYKKIIIK